MGEWQTEAEFRNNLNTSFRVVVDTTDGLKAIELILVEVTSRPSESHEQAGMERFSAVFAGPLDFFLPQQTYGMVHPEMGEFDVFLSAIAKEDDGYKYEAVYNFFIPSAD